MILCCGEALIDMIPLEGGKFLPCPGGCAYNSAVAIARLGAPVAFLGKLSTDFFGDMLINRLQENGVDAGLCIRTGRNTTLAFINLEPGRDPRYAFYIEGSTAPSLALEDLPPRLPSDCTSILFGSISMNMEPSASTIEALLRREWERETSLRVRAPSLSPQLVISLDPNVRPFMIRDRKAYRTRFEGWLPFSAIVKLSSEDLAFIYPDQDPEETLGHILDRGPQIAFCTLGPAGVLALIRREKGGILKLEAPVIDLPVADTVGAGDTFHGAFLSWLERRGLLSRSALGQMSEADLFEAVFFANKAASLVCSRHGAEPPTLEEVERL